MVAQTADGETNEKVQNRSNVKERVRGGKVREAQRGQGLDDEV